MRALRNLGSIPREAGSFRRKRLLQTEIITLAAGSHDNNN